MAYWRAAPRPVRWYRGAMGAATWVRAMMSTAESPTLGDLLGDLRAASGQGLADVHFRAVAAQLPAIVRVIGRDGTYLLSEGGALATIGRAPGDLVGRSIFDLHRDRPEILADLRRALD